MVRRTKAFTLIELLVVIAIIGILAAMVFPVFARARESARKAVCLSNVKNIALAMQMYLADNNDTMPPGEHRQEVLDYFAADPAGGGEGPDAVSWCVPQANPFLRVPVVLDEYVKNRDVWNCPSAKLIGGATFIIPLPDWFRYFQENEGRWGAVADYTPGPCHWTFPNGWGGDVTDSIAQGRYATPWSGGQGATDAAQKAFTQTIATRAHYDLKMPQIGDPVSFVICSDGGSNSQDQSLGGMAYPDLCCVDCSGINWSAWGWPTVSDPIKGITDCPNGDYCPECWAAKADLAWHKNPDRKNATARHLGGVNVGFADGHASWMRSQQVLTLFADGELEGVGLWCTGSTRAGYEEACGTPPAGAEFLY
ncbi:MAG: DUF1559 domain-containing protein [Armatimonadota bacterium]